MSATAIVVGVGCLLQSGPDPSERRVHVATVVASPTCSHIDVPVPPREQTVILGARVRTSKGSRKLMPERIERRTRDVVGHGFLRIHTPELRNGDQLRIRYRTEELASPPQRTLSLGTDARITPTSVERRETLKIPYGDPQVVLYPGGGAVTDVLLGTSFAPRSEAGAWVLPFPKGVSNLTYTVSPERGGKVIVRDDSALVVVLPTEANVRVDLRWTQPDAATFGRLPDGGAHSVRVEDGLLGWNDDGLRWWLVGVHNAAVLPTTEALARALARRFDNARLREPALPPPLRGAQPDLQLLQLLTTYVQEHTRWATWPHQPTLPRPVTRAFREGAMTEVEAGLVLHALLQQAGFDSSWRLVRPLGQSPAHDASLSGYEHMLVRVVLEDGEQWIDLRHGVGTIRPELLDGLWIGQEGVGTVPSMEAFPDEP